MWERFAACVRAIKTGSQPDEFWPRIALLTQQVLCAVADSLSKGGQEVAFSP